MYKLVIYWFIFLFVEMFLWTIGMHLLSVASTMANFIGLGIILMAILVIIWYFEHMIYKDKINKIK